MEGQTNSFLRKFGTSAGLIREDKALDLKIEKGECSVVLSSPKSFSRNWLVAKVSRKNWTFLEVLCKQLVFYKSIMYSHLTATIITIYFNGT